MPRQLRIEFPGALYHVLSRGDQRQDIFVDETDPEIFLTTLSEACLKTGWQVHAYCLMRNHFHIILETPQPNLVAGMKWFLGVYTQRFNLRHKSCGHLFAGRYKSFNIDGGNSGYFRTVCDYVHLNPIRAKLIQAKAPLESFQASSYPLYLKTAAQRPAWLRVDRLLGAHGIPKDSLPGRTEFARRMEQRRLQEEGADYQHLRRGWFLGSDDFRKELLAIAGRKPTPTHGPMLSRETDHDQAARIIRDGLKQLGLKESDLPNLPKGAAPKVKLARQLRRETTLTLKAIASSLHMGSWTYVSNLLSVKSED